MSAIEYINVGTQPNDGTGDSLREAFVKCNNNFGSIDAALFNSDTVNLSNLNLTGNLFLYNTENATGPLTGALIVMGGASISQDLYIGGSTTISGDLTVNGTILQVGDLSTLTTTNKTTVVNAINEINSSVTALETSVTSINGSITTINNSISNIQGSISTINNSISTIETDIDNVAQMANFTVNVVSTNTQAVKNNLYVLTGSCTITCPANPAVGDAFQVNNQSGTTTCVIARNGQKINRLDEDMTINLDYASFNLKYVNSTVGWILL